MTVSIVVVVGAGHPVEDETGSNWLTVLCYAMLCYAVQLLLPPPSP